jgi:hypothetical protein
MPCHRAEPASMYSDMIYAFALSIAGAILFLLVDRYEPHGPTARLLKFLILFVSGVAIMHKLRPYGFSLF